MKIINVTPGLISIPPNGWGAVEKIIWEYHQILQKKGYQSEISYLNDVKYDKNTIVHIHVANLALMANALGIPYYFTCHDHHAYLYGKNSTCFKDNYDAIKYSIKSFVPAKYLVEYFELDNLYYLSHGVNNDVFIPKTYNVSSHKLLCVANNGFMHDPSEDRKGFGFAIEAAKKLNLPITIAGPKNNENFFNKCEFHYDNLTILYDLSEKQLVDLYQNHTIFVHPSILEAGHPNLTLLEAIGCGLPVVGTFEDNNDLDGMVKISRNVESVIDGIKTVINNYDYYRNKCDITRNFRSWEKIIDELLLNYSLTTMRDKLLQIYTNAKINIRESEDDYNKLSVDFNNTPKVEITGDLNKQYSINFIDKQNNQSIYKTSIKNNMWASADKSYYIDWNIKVTDEETKSTLDYDLDLKNKIVRIDNDSPSLGDFLAWVPYVDMFQSKHNCIVDFFTPHKNLVESSYKNINFYNYNTKLVKKYYASYKIGYFDPSDRSKTPTDCRTINLQKIASDILGLPYTDIKPKISMPNNLKNRFDKKYVCIGSLSTAQSKFWNNPTGWDRVVEYLHTLNYDVVSIDKDNNIGNSVYRNYIPKNSIDCTGNLSLEHRINDLHFCDFFIGLGSGLSWLAWSVGKPVVLISGFSDPISEFYTPYRVHNKSVCNSCWNDTNFIFDSSKWDWCPRNKNFECSKEITFEMVKEKIDNVINDLDKKYNK